MKKVLIGFVLAMAGAGWASDGAAVRPCAMERLPPSPVPAVAVNGKAETVELVPIALTQLRITFFPWTK